MDGGGRKAGRNKRNIILIPRDFLALKACARSSQEPRTSSSSTRYHAPLFFN